MESRTLDLIHNNELLAAASVANAKKKFREISDIGSVVLGSSGYHKSFRATECLAKMRHECRGVPLRSQAVYRMGARSWRKHQMKLPQHVLDQFRAAGKKGGTASASNLTPEQRKAKSAKAIAARWAKRAALTFKTAIEKLPLCLIGAENGNEKTLTDLWYMARIQLDLFEEGQECDDMTAKDAATIRKYLAYLGGTLQEPPK